MTRWVANPMVIIFDVVGFTIIPLSQGEALLVQQAANVYVWVDYIYRYLEAETTETLPREAVDTKGIQTYQNSFLS